MTQIEIVDLLKESGVWDEIGYPTCIDKLIDLVAAYEREKQAEQEPVAFIGQGLKPIVPEDLEKLRKHEPGTATLYDTSLYAAPVRTKDPCHPWQDLTDDEIWEIWLAQVVCAHRVKLFARAVIAKFKEKNK